MISKQKAQDILLKLFRFTAIKNIIVFESKPDLADNTKFVFDELVRRGLNKKYKMYWYVNSKRFKCDYPKIPNVYYLDSYTPNRLHNILTGIKKTYIDSCAKAFVICNEIIPRAKKKQYVLFLSHGAAMKDCSKTYYILGNRVDEFVSLSEYLQEKDVAGLLLDASVKLLPLGFARNDVLFGERLDLKSLFGDCNFNKVIYWMPTYRQHNLTGVSVSSIQMPIMYNEEIAAEINNAAKRNNVLLILKPHPAQDMSKIVQTNFSNLRIINDNFLKANRIENYELLRSSDALITDYSSVYYDYLLCNKPIGLCFDDFEEYSRREGFVVDTDVVLAGGEKIYNTQDMCDFLTRIANGQDVLKNERDEIMHLCHKHIDNLSTKRIADHFEKKLTEI